MSKHRKKTNKGAGAQVAIICVTIILTLVTAVAGTGCAAWVYMRTTPDILPITSDTTYVSTVYDTIMDEERYFVEVDYYTANSGYGKEVVEVTFNAYTDYEYSAVKGRGVQFIDVSGSETTADLSKWVQNEYNRDMGIGYVPVEKLEWGDVMYVSLDDAPYGVSFNGTYKQSHTEYNAWTGFTNFVTGRWRSGMSSFTYETDEPYTMAEFWQALVKNITANSVGTGEYVISLVELSRYFGIYTINPENGQLDKQTTTFQDDYFAIKLRVHSNGMTKASQSAFGMYNRDNSWTITGLESDTKDYADVSTLQLLSAEDFDYTLALDINAYVPSIKQSVKERLIAANTNAVSITIDFDDNFFTNAHMQNLFLLGAEFLDDLDIDIASIKLKYNLNDDFIPLYIDKGLYAKFDINSSVVETSNKGNAAVQKIEFNYTVQGA